jgi:hypothetical protein
MRATLLDDLPVSARRGSRGIAARGKTGSRIDSVHQPSMHTRPDLDEDDEILEDEEFDEDADPDGEDEDFDPDEEDEPETWQVVAA